MTLLEFIKAKQTVAENKRIVTEAFKTSDVDKAHELMLKLFKDKIGKNVIMDPSPIATRIDGKDAISVTFIALKNGNKEIDMMWNLNYLVSGKSSAVYSVDFFNADQAKALLFGDGEASTALTLFTMGQSVAYFLPLIIHVVKNHDYSLAKDKAEKIAKQAFTSKANESYAHWQGAFKYVIHEGLDTEVIDNAFHIAQGHHMAESADGFIWETEAEDVKKKVRKAEVESWKTKGDSEEARQRSIELDRDYRDICKAIKGGATTLKDLELSLGRKIKVVYNVDDSVKDADKELAEKAKKKDPNQAFKEMQGYVKTVINGLQPGVILCGAPGIGKTYRVLQQLKANKYVNGQNMNIIKGKCTTRQLYIDLYNFQDKGQITVIDDADSLIGTKAPEDTINILKAALDSTSDDEGRLVSYKISGKLEDEEGNPIPKQFYYRGSVIVITNYSVGQLDTAVRGRVFTQSLDFTTDQLLGIIEQLIPAIEPNKLSMKCKEMAFEYLKELAANGSQMEISIRTFGTCARLFQVCDGDPDFTEEDARSMIAEQLSNQAIRGGKKY